MTRALVATLASSSTQTERGRVHTEPSMKRVRTFLRGDLVADSTQPMLVWEKPYYPTYYFPSGDIRAELIATDQIKHSPSRGDGRVYDVKVGTDVAPGAALRYPDSPLEQLRDLVRLEWVAMTEWLEEDEPVYTHPRDPYTRVDILASSRHVRVELDGIRLADSHQPRILFETGLPPRYYLPLSHIRMDLLHPSATETHCPYKGTATYWSVHSGDRVYEDYVWIYRSPLPESQKIAGLASFYNEKVDIYIDEELQERPRTHFS